MSECQVIACHEPGTTVLPIFAMWLEGRMDFEVLVCDRHAEMVRQNKGEADDGSLTTEG